MTREEIMQHGVTISRRITRPEDNPRGLVKVRARARDINAPYVPSYRIPLERLPNTVRETMDKMDIKNGGLPEAKDLAPSERAPVRVYFIKITDTDEAQALADALNTYGEKQ